MKLDIPAMDGLDYKITVIDVELPADEIEDPLDNEFAPLLGMAGGISEDKTEVSLDEEISPSLDATGDCTDDETQGPLGRRDHIVAGHDRGRQRRRDRGFP
ncbi:hypothetical protein MRX96_023719 [Rhipicephalus microplus]